MARLHRSTVWRKSELKRQAECESPDARGSAVSRMIDETSGPGPLSLPNLLVAPVFHAGFFDWHPSWTSTLFESAVALAVSTWDILRVTHDPSEQYSDSVLSLMGKASIYEQHTVAQEE